jgi:hypothetical protein
MSHILRIFGTVQLFGLLAASLAPANAAQIELNANAPHLCVAVSGGSTAPGTPVVAYSCSGAPNYRWNYVNGQFQGLGTYNGATRCLDVIDNGVVAGTPVDLWPCTGQLNQQWQINDGQIIGVQSGMCLESTGSGNQLVISPCTGASSQNWILRGMQFELTASTPLCVSVYGGDTANGTPIVAASCADAPNQLWNYKDNNLTGLGSWNGTFTCLTSSGLAIGSEVTLSSCVAGSPTQQWTISPAPSNKVSLISSDLCLDSTGPNFHGTPQVVVKPCSGAASQNWNLR